MPETCQVRVHGYPGTGGSYTCNKRAVAWPNRQGEFVCSTHRDIHSWKAQERAQEQQQRLAALAPELLALLRRLLPWVDDVAVTSLRGRQFADDIRGTLAKADGEEPR